MERRVVSAAGTLAGLLAIDKGNLEASYWLARAYQALGGVCSGQTMEHVEPLDRP